MADLAHGFAASWHATPRDGSAARLAPHRHRNLSASVRRAQPADFGALRRLINVAYAVERGFVDGERIDAAEVTACAERGHFLILDGGPGEIAAAVQVRIEDDGAGTIGLLAVAPDWQGLGLGRRLIAVAEALCTALGCPSVQLQIVNLRQELGPWYRSQGYREIGTAPYDHRPAKQPCHFICMRKPLG